MAITFTTRAGKGSAISHNEMDTNLNNIATAFPSVSESDVVTATAAELNKLDGFTGSVTNLNNIASLTIDLGTLTATASELNLLDGFTGTTNDLNILAGAYTAGIRAAELQYLDGLTANIQGQLDTKLRDTNNLSELTSASTARSNLGLGTLAIQNEVDSSDIEAAAPGNKVEVTVGDLTTPTSTGIGNVVKTAKIYVGRSGYFHLRFYRNATDTNDTAHWVVYEGGTLVYDVAYGGTTTGDYTVGSGASFFVGFNSYIEIGTYITHVNSGGKTGISNIALCSDNPFFSSADYVAGP